VGSASPKLQVIALFVVRICGAVFLGWWLMTIPFLLGLNSWGLFHSGLVILVLPFFVALAYWLIGLMPIFRSTRAKKVPL
jgi:hypothetical protein